MQTFYVQPGGKQTNH